MVARRRRPRVQILILTVTALVMALLQGSIAGRHRLPLPPYDVWSTHGSAAGKSHRASTAETQAASKGGVEAAPVRKAPGEVAVDSGHRSALPKAPKVGGGPVDNVGPASVPKGRYARKGRTAVPSLWTPTKRVYRNADGSLTTDITAEAQNYRDSHGTWKPIDAKLTSTGKGEYRTAAAPVRTTLRGTGGTGSYATLDLAGGRSIGYRLLGARRSTPSGHGDTATYRGVLAGVGLSVQSLPTGMKESLVLTSRAAPASYTFALELHGLSARLDPDSGSVVLVDKSGQPAASIPAGFMLDSKIDPGSGEGVRSNGVRYTLVTLPDGRPGLRLDLDQAWLDDPARQFPVTVDPTTSNWNTLADDTYVMSPYKNNYSGETEIKSGKCPDSSCNYAAAYLHFDLGGLNGYHILAANFWLYNTHSDSCQAWPVNAYRVTTGWNGNTLMTWPGPSTGDFIGGRSFAHGNTGCAAAWDDFDVTGAVSNWTHGVWPNYGISVRSDTSNVRSWKRFASANTANPPRLEITYTPDDATYQTAASWTQLPTASQEGILAVTATNRGHDTWPANGTIGLSYQVQPNGGSVRDPAAGHQYAPTVNVPPGGSFTTNVHVEPLTPGTYALYFGMRNGTTWFSSEYVKAQQINVTVGNVFPSITKMLPADGVISSTLTPTLTTLGTDPDHFPAVAYNQWQYQFEVCPDAVQSSACQSATVPQRIQTGPPVTPVDTTWTVPNGFMKWRSAYFWHVRMSDTQDWGAWTPWSQITLQVPQPAGANVGDDPNGATVNGVTLRQASLVMSGTDASVATAGPALDLVRTYNSATTTVGAFGRGWSSPWDLSAKPDPSFPGAVLVTYPSGRVLRYGRNPDGTLAALLGDSATLTGVSAVSDQFARADNASTLGSATSGQAWSSLAGGWGVSGNRAYLAAAPASGRALAVQNLAASGSFALTEPVVQDGLGLAFRVKDASNYFRLVPDSASSTWKLIKTVGGTDTVLGSTPAGTCCTANTRISVTSRAAHLTAAVNDTVQLSVDDWDLTDAGRVGLVADATGAGRVSAAQFSVGSVTDAFGRPDAGTLGTTPQGAQWRALAGTWGISGGQAVLSQAAGTANLAVTDAAADGTFGFTLPVQQAGVGLAFRVQDATNYWRVVADPATGRWQLVKRVNGTDVATVTSGSVSWDPSDVMQVVTAGPLIRLLRNGSEIARLVDGQFSGAAQAGPFAAATGAGRVDNVSFDTAYALRQHDGTTLTFDTSGKLIQVIDPSGVQDVLYYDDQGLLSTVSNTASGRNLAVGWDGHGHVASVTTDADPGTGARQQWLYTYTGDDLTQVCAPPGNQCMKYGYEAAGGADRIDLVTLPRGNVYAKVGYDSSSGKVAWREDGLTHRWTYASTTAADGTQTVTVTNPRSKSQVFVYDPAGRVVSETAATGSKTTYTYNELGFLARVTDANGNYTDYGTDYAGNTLRTSTCRHTADQICNSSYATYFAATSPLDLRANKQTSTQDGRSFDAADVTYRTTFGYDYLGNLTSTTLPLTSGQTTPRTTTASYSTGTEDAVGGGKVPPGLLLTTTNLSGHATIRRYDSHGDLREVQDPAGLLTRYDYDWLGREKTQTVVSDAYPAGATTTYTYDTAGRPATTTLPRTTNQITSASSQLRATFGYDDNGNVTSVTEADASGTGTSRVTSYDYDDDDRVKLTTDPETGKTKHEYDPAGNVSAEVLPNGARYEYGYTDDDQPSTVVLKSFVDDPVNPGTPRDVTLESRAYDPAGRLASVTDALGRTTAYTYYDDGLTATATLKNFHSAGDNSTRDVCLASYDYDQAGQLTSRNCPGDRYETTSYDADGMVVQQAIDPGGLSIVTANTYDQAGHLVQVDHAQGTRTDTIRYGYDAADRLVSQAVANGSNPALTSWIGYDQRGLPTAVTDPRGASASDSAYTARLSYDELGRLTRMIAPPVQVERNGQAATTANPTTLTGYDVFGNKTDVEDPLGNTTTTGYDKLGRPTSATLPAYTRPADGNTLNVTLKAGYDPLGNVTSLTDGRNHTTTNTYDLRGRLVQVQDPAIGTSDPGKQRFGYDDAGNVTNYTNQTGAAYHFAYDDLDHLRASTTVERYPTPVNLTTGYVYDDTGNLQAVTTPTGDTTTYGYDPANELVSVTDPLGHTSTSSYQLGRLTQKTDPQNRMDIYGYDGAGRLTQSVEYGSPGVGGLRPSHTRNATYDAADNLTSLTDANNNTTTLSWDAANQLRSATRPLTGTDTATDGFGYDAAGNLTRTTDGRGVNTVRTYNPWNLPESTVEPATTTHPDPADRTFTTSYDAAGNPTTVRQPGPVTITGVFDELNRLTSESGTGAESATATRTFGYDLAGRLTSFSHPGGTEQLTYNDRDLPLTARGPAGNADLTYDNVGRLSQRTDAAGTTTFGYNGAGQLTTVTDPLTSVSASYGYNADSQLTSIGYGTGGPNRTFGYDAFGRISSDTVKSPTGTVTYQTGYGYDNERLTSRTLGPAGVAGAGTSTYGYDKSDELTSWTPPGSSTATSYTYDKAGNRLTAGATTYTYDERDELTSDGTNTYAYSARGTRQNQLVGPTLKPLAFDAFDQLTVDGGSTNTYDALGRLASSGGSSLSYSALDTEPSLDGTAKTSRLPDGNLVSATSGSSGRFAVSNSHRDLTALVSPTDGSTSATRDASPTGVPTATTGTVDTPAGYQGQHTSSSGLVHMGARWYDPGTATFTSRDTVSDGLNHYSYVHNDPTDNTDPSGHRAADPGGSGLDAVDTTLSQNQRYQQARINDGLRALTRQVRAHGLGGTGLKTGQRYDDSPLVELLIDEIEYYLYGQMLGWSKAGIYAAGDMARMIILDAVNSGEDFAWALSAINGSVGSAGHGGHLSGGGTSGGGSGGHGSGGRGGRGGSGHGGHSNGGTKVLPPPPPPPWVHTPQPIPAHEAWHPSPVEAANPGGTWLDGVDPNADPTTIYVPIACDPRSLDCGAHDPRDPDQKPKRRGPKDCSPTGQSWVEYLPTDPTNNDRATGMIACLHDADIDYKGGSKKLDPNKKPNLIGTKSKSRPSATPPGYVRGVHEKGHLLARQLGGSGTKLENLVPLYPNANNPVMYGYEEKVANALKSGETVFYVVTPVYRGSDPVPIAVTMYAHGSGGLNFAVTVLNK